MRRFLITLLILATTAAHAEIPLSRSLVSGNAFINPQSIEKIVKELIVNQLKKGFDAQSEYGGITLETDSSEHQLKIPQKALLREIMKTLGISDRIRIVIDPIKTSINFGQDSLKIKVNKLDTNVFNIKAHWEVSKLSAISKALKIHVPKGMFDRSFTISSSPVKIALRPGLGPITADVSLTATLTNSGSFIRLDSFHTNLSDKKPRLKVKLGLLTVNGKPLELEIMSNGQSILTDEKTIREEFQSFEPELMGSVQGQLSAIIQHEFEALSTKLGNQDPFKISFNSNEILSKYSFKNAALDTLFKNITTDFIFSYVQELPEQNLLTTQVASQICLGTDCLHNTVGTGKISSEDIESLSGQDVAVILHESWVQNVINSKAFQKRVREFYKKTLKSPGVALGKDGIKLHFNPAKNAIIAVVNMVIDIKATADAATALNSWSSFKNFTKKQLADMWENVAGSGQYVVLPVEITVKIKGIETDAQGKRVLALGTEIPFRKDGTITNTYKYPSNVQHMNKTIKKELLTSVKKEFGSSLPATIKIALDEPLEMNGIKIDINQVRMTKTKGLLVSGSIK